MSETAKSWLWFVIDLVIVGVVVVLLDTFLIANHNVVGPSMEPNFMNNDRVLVWRHSKLERGDVVILHAPDGSMYIKRIIGMPGDTVRSKNDTMYVNGKKLSEPYLANYKEQQAANNDGLFTDNFSLNSLFHRKTVPKGEYFVMGDNRPISKDSRMIGFIPRGKIQGKVVWRYWPLNKMSVY
ncbi:signal peptidase I [Loigolactobacillus backii]|uniref:Signal peptidase I n=1 Tax=Loigolactobacillus backii TaxID=375175 RepID=A0A192GZX2_9LACO|nr:signal peptidase I [Loigolactobacillus backii]ANK60779.1 signal peptidase I [Loigolactobacillus backii]ANK61650.1 signal peptidase I [Loigolactobacillus backii]ANK65733.1 signal peptidase I [Loigolactobacillus backii]ANK68209.1 signal peptidase I [Loigolactobacillus backii]ANK69151.1 signal peptidase I [Loigolactobacillus backii]